MLIMLILTVAGSDLAGVYVSVHLTCVAQSFPEPVYLSGISPIYTH